VTFDFSLVTEEQKNGSVEPCMYVFIEWCLINPGDNFSHYTSCIQFPNDDQFSRNRNTKYIVRITGFLDFVHRLAF
jgi:hypothetical protein